jgi:hypothetical protein
MRDSGIGELLHRAELSLPTSVYNPYEVRVSRQAHAACCFCAISIQCSATRGRQQLVDKFYLVLSNVTNDRLPESRWIDTIEATCADPAAIIRCRLTGFDTATPAMLSAPGVVVRIDLDPTESAQRIRDAASHTTRRLVPGYAAQSYRTVRSAESLPTSYPSSSSQTRRRTWNGQVPSKPIPAAHAMPSLG